ncbi:hypothetical protein B0J14DRAFT_632416 [Halenospora varia]|nr:hypothetical protein B0J14DRAFT_632416 [Halenospora varia]
MSTLRRTKFGPSYLLQLLLGITLLAPISGQELPKLPSLTQLALLALMENPARNKFQLLDKGRFNAGNDSNTMQRREAGRIDLEHGRNQQHCEDYGLPNPATAPSM